jgi:hypothetical protein
MRKPAWHRGVFSIAALVVVLFAAYAAYWHIVAQRLRDGLDPWAEAQRAQGLSAQWDQVEIGGFPSAFRFRFAKASFSTARPLPASLTAPSLTVWAAPWNLRHWQFAAEDGAQLDVTNLAAFALRRIDGSAVLDGDDAAVLDAAAAGIKGGGLLAQSAAIATATAHVEIPAHAPAGHQETALRVALQLTDITLPVDVVPSFGDRVSELSFAAELKGALPPGPLSAALVQWRDGGGTIELQSFRLHWGVLLVDASGTLALDNELQPEGAFSAVITGQDAIIDLAVKAGAIQAQSGGIAKGILSLLAKPGPNGEKAITVPLTLQQRRLFLGPAAVAEVPPIKWE